MKCEYPDCPSGINSKLLDERHTEVRNHLTVIENGQNKMIAVAENVAILITEVQNIKRDSTENIKQHDEMFGRLRKTELRVSWFAGGASAIVVVLEALRASGVLK